MGDLEPGYWLHLTLNVACYYWRQRRPVAGLRALWAVVIRHDNSESCQRCGRGYMLWRTADALYEQVHGNREGLLCPACFDTEASKTNVSLIWHARRFQ